MEKVTVVLKGGPFNGEQVEVEKGRLYIEVAGIETPSEVVLKERNATISRMKDYNRYLYLLSNKSDLEYIYSEPKN